MPAPGPSVQRYLALRERLSTPLPTTYNIAEATCLRWAGQPGRTALIVPEDGTIRRHTFAEVAESSARLANGLDALGVRRGDRVVVSLPQSFECAVSHVAVQRLGAIAVPVSTAYGPEAFGYRLAASNPRVAIGSADAHAWVADHELRDACAWIMAGGRAGAGAAFDDVVRRGSDRGPTTPTRIDDPAVLVYTSGTTGPAKGVVHAQRVVPAHAEPISLAHDLFPQEGDVLWSPADWAWVGGLVDSLFAAWAAGRPVVAWRPPRFDPSVVVDTMVRCRVTNAFLPPTALRMLRELPDAEVRAGELCLRSVMTGSERVGEDVIEWSRATLGIVPNEVFGQTEASCVLGNSATVLPVVPGSVGMEYPRARVEILDDSDDPMAPGETGEICIHRSTPAMFVGYWADGAAAAVDDGQWHRTGDLGVRDDDGYFWHRGRRDDLILSAGYRIGPEEVEACLAVHPAVRAVAVVGAPDPVRGETVTAVVELLVDGPVDEPERARLGDELRALVRSRLAPYQVPRRFLFVGALPRTDTGKVRRAAIRRDLVGAVTHGTTSVQVTAVASDGLAPSVTTRPPVAPGDAERDVAGWDA